MLCIFYFYGYGRYIIGIEECLWWMRMQSTLKRLHHIFNVWFGRCRRRVLEHATQVNTQEVLKYSNKVISFPSRHAMPSKKRISFFVLCGGVKREEGGWSLIIQCYTKGKRARADYHVVSELLQKKCEEGSSERTRRKTHHHRRYHHQCLVVVFVCTLQFIFWCSNSSYNFKNTLI